MSSSHRQNQGIPGAFRNAAAVRPDQPLLLGAGDAWSFSRLDETSERIAAALAAGGIRGGDRVALYSPNAPELVAVYLGILKAGATVVPINILLSPREVAFILDDAGVRGLFFHAALADGAARATEAGSGPGLLVRIGGGGGVGTCLEDFVSRGGEVPALDMDPVSQLAAILYTSGTTGRPKGAMLSHANLMANSAAVMQALQLRPGEDRLLVVLPMFHAFAATVGMLTPMLHGLALVIAPRFDPKPVSALIEEHRATVFLGVPSMFSLLLRLEDRDLARWRSVRFCVSGGAAMPEAVMAAFEERFGIPVLEGDGPTECSPVTCVNPVSGPRKPGSVGLPVPGVAMHIAAADGTTLADGELGEVCVRGPSVMRGYWGLEAETAASFHGDWFRTGDLGYRDGEGYFFLVDRIKDLIIVNGMNVYPRSVEEVLYRHPQVAEAAVVGEPHALHGEVPVAYVVAKAGAAPSAAQLRGWCREHLGRHEVPRRVHLLASLPKNAAGKILKRELRRHGEVERGVNAAGDPP